MLGRALLWASESPRVQRMITEGRLGKSVVDRFVAGDRLEDAIEAIRRLNDRGIGGILDLLGEGVKDPSGAAAAAHDYSRAIDSVKRRALDTTLSVKLTQLGLAFDKEACVEHLRSLAAQAREASTGVEIDMEQSDYVADTLEVYKALHADFPETRVAVQAYLRRTPIDLNDMAALTPKIRLVKGAYAEPDHLALQKRKEIDNQYAFLTDFLLDIGEQPAIATHDEALLNHAFDSAQRRGLGTDALEIQMLYGVRRDLQLDLAARGCKVKVYVPYGSAWYPYLMRRIAERPANVRFFARALVGR